MTKTKELPLQGIEVVTHTPLTSNLYTGWIDIVHDIATVLGGKVRENISTPNHLQDVQLDDRTLNILISLIKNSTHKDEGFPWSAIIQLAQRSTFLLVTPSEVWAVEQAKKLLAVNPSADLISGQYISSRHMEKPTYDALAEGMVNMAQSIRRT